MRHKKIQSTKRHKKLKVVEGLSKHNVVRDKVLSRNKEQGIPKKLAEMIRLKTEIRDSNVALSNKKSKNKNRKIAAEEKDRQQKVTKEIEAPEIEFGMTRLPSKVPDKIERKQYESDKSYMNRLNRLVARAINDANIEQHFDIDLGGKIANNDGNTADKTTPEDDQIKLLSKSNPKKAKKLEELKEQRLEKRKQKNLERKERKLKKKRRLNAKITNDQSDLYRKDHIAFGERVDHPPELNFSKKFHKKTN